MELQEPVEEVGHGHHLRSCDADAKRGFDRLEINKGEEAEAAKAEVPTR